MAGFEHAPGGRNSRTTLLHVAACNVNTRSRGRGSARATSSGAQRANTADTSASYVSAELPAIRIGCGHSWSFLALSRSTAADAPASARAGVVGVRKHGRRQGGRQLHAVVSWLLRGSRPSPFVIEPATGRSHLKRRGISSTRAQGLAHPPSHRPVGSMDDDSVVGNLSTRPGCVNVAQNRPHHSRK